MVVVVEFTVNVALAGVVPLIVTGEVTEHVGTLVPVAGVTAQVNATAPVNPPEGVTVTVEVPLAPPAAKVIALPVVSVMAGATVPPFCV